ncbi:hypothetical protein BV25DRAFT_1889472 [Artomyces pyxidatus]|uniref:Uncharacterized protein n=1 Tax=Artomyces pyxidatus TaxID=48021 RepID=A0ACB8STQ1_9AGAM|nr:hypothetical protein BV25DRAFT_1889472 [Artomyces pyxidatus]
MQAAQSKRRFTPEEKQQLLANLDIEVAHRTRQLESWLTDTLAGFRNRHERQIAYIPHLVRGVTMAEFGDKYNGDIQACLRGLQKEKLGVDVAPIDRTAMKRKWVATTEADNDSRGEGSSTGGGHEANTARAPKNARMTSMSPQKRPPFSAGTAASRSRVPSATTPGTSRNFRRVPSAAPSPSPHKATRLPTRPPSRPVSPAKPTASSSVHQTRATRPPSTATFNPTLPKTPAYPPRWPRKDESMLSVNGSPLTNPYELGLDWLAGENSPADPVTEERAPRTRTLSRTNSIVIRPSSSGLHSRSNSQTNLLPSSQSTHSRSGSQTGKPLSQLGSSSSGHLAARVAVPTRDGHMLEFDPLLTSPAALDTLDGITDSAKKQAKEDMSKLLQAAVAKWNIK